MDKKSFTECLRSNIQENLENKGTFAAMTKDDCLKACNLIETLTAENKKLKWTLVSDELPKESEELIFFIYCGLIITGTFRQSSSGIGKPIFWNKDGACFEKYPYENVLCWMYVPEIPKS